MSTYFYEVHGLVLRSELFLPELEPRRLLESDHADLVVTVSPASESEPVVRSEIHIEPRRAIFALAGLGRYDIREGTLIVISPEPTADFAAIRLYLLGSALGLALHQRGRLLLHASAVAVDGLALAFVGEQGQGKSTLAAHCVTHESAQLVCDDTLAVSFDEDGQPWAQPGIPTLKLWRDALRSLGKGTEDMRPDWYRAEKFHWPQSESSSRQPVPLREVLVLAEDAQAGAGCFSEIRGSAAAVALIDHTYRIEHLDAKIQRANHFTACMRLANCIPVRLFSRAHHLQGVQETAKLLVSHFRMEQVG